MKFTHFDRVLLILAALLLLAMAATLIFGKGRSRHGYGVLEQLIPASRLSALADTLSPPTRRCRHPNCRPPHSRVARES